MQNPDKYNQVLDSGGSLKLPGTQLPDDARDSISEYLKNFPYKIEITVGRTYTQDFKELYSWCERNLGAKYKDWFLTGSGGIQNNKYTLFLKDSKKSMFLALKFSESIDSTSQL